MTVMKPYQEQLEALSGSGDDFVARAYELTDAWVAAGAGIEAVEPVLRFMEAHASTDFGAPGPLVHFVERFHGAAYREVLTASLGRLPTAHTAWMANRVLNGTTAPEERARLIEVMERARLHPAADAEAVAALTGFLERQGKPA
jgi:hypothetical protein